MQGDAGRVDPTNLDRDRGPNILDQRHTFSGSVVAIPKVDAEGFAGALLNDNVFGLAMQFASGIPVNLRSNQELNNDGTASDRPSGVARNSLQLPARYNVDARYSRRFRIQGDMAAEVIAEIKNVFNTVQVAGVNCDDCDQHAWGAAGGAADERGSAAADRLATSSVSSSSASNSSSKAAHEISAKSRA